MSIWYVFQNKTFKEESSGEYLWSPQKNKKGSNNDGYVNMSNVKKDDIIFYGFQAKTVAVSFANTDCYESDITEELIKKTEDTWNKKGYRVDSDYIFLMPLLICEV